MVKIVRESDETEFNLGTDKWGIVSLDGFGTLDKDIIYLDNILTDGGTIVNERLGSKDRTIVARHLALDNNAHARREANAFFRAHDTYRVYLTYGNQTYWMRGNLYKYSCGMPPWIRDTIELVLTFTSSSPYMFSFDDFGKNIAGRTAHGGFPYIAKRYGAKRGHIVSLINFDTNVFIENKGDVETDIRVIMTANGEVVNPSITVNDHTVKVNDTLYQNDRLELDFTQRPPTVKKNGVNNIGKCDRSSEFNKMTLKLGTNVVRYDCDSGTNVVNVMIYYNQMYGAI